jgi:hypothetical protein
MTQKERVTGLFEFLMDLLDEKTSKPVEETKSELNSEPIKVLQNPTLPHHPLLNPYINSNDGKPSWVDGSLEMMNKIAAIDKERAEERNKIRIADNATRPLINQLRELKEQGHKNALEVKENEELETIIGEVGDKLGITLENGKVKLVNVPTELRDNIPLDDESIVSDDLPKHIEDKLDTKISVTIPEPMTRTEPTKKTIGEKNTK